MIGECISSLLGTKENTTLDRAEYDGMISEARAMIVAKYAAMTEDFDRKGRVQDNRCQWRSQRLGTDADGQRLKREMQSPAKTAGGVH